MECLYVISTISIICLTLMSSIEGHGRLKVPPSRSSMWRYGFSTPENYNDHELYCGGFQHQWANNGGKCGICGDPYDGVRENEAGGKYATGTISRTYLEGSLIQVSVEITAHHKGWFEFRLCPNNNPNVAATHDCLNQNLLQFNDGTTRYGLPISSKSGDTHNVMLQLPAGLTCEQCVFQWKYHTGNSWGCDSVNDCAVGKGPQEEFYGCADIKIVSTTGAQSSSTTSGSNTGSTTTPTTTNANTASTNGSNTDSTTTPSTTSANTASTTSTAGPSTTVTSPTTTRTDTTKVCQSAGAWEGQASMDAWCRDNCAVGYCPSTHCKCVTKTKSDTTTTTATTTTTSQTATTTSATTTTTSPTSTTTGQNKQDCTTYKSVNDTAFENQVCEYSCLIKKSCPQDQCVCSSDQPRVQQYTGPAGVQNADEYCSVICAYGQCPSQCQIMDCTTYKSVNDTPFENQVCEYSCLIKKSCPQDQCVCSSDQPRVQQYTGPVGVQNAGEYCSVICAYGQCPSQCQIMV